MTTREHIVEAADRLFYQQGFEHTSFSDIADAVRISRGNFYYHFKAKDEILDAVIDLRLANTRNMLADWEAEGQDPRERIRCFVRILTRNREDIKRFGCPLGTLRAELSKLEHLSQDHAKKLFTLFREWLRTQFHLLDPGSDADQRAMHVLAWSQGVAVLANTFRDDEFIDREVERMCAWLETCSPTGPGSHAQAHNE